MDTFVANFASRTQDGLTQQINDYAFKNSLLIKQVSVGLTVNAIPGYAYAFVVFERKSEK